MSNPFDEFIQKKPQSSAVERLAGEAKTENEQEDIDYKAFGVHRGRRQAVMLDVQRLDKTRRAFPYSYLTSIFFDASGRIALSFTSHSVEIMGRNLLPLYEAFLNHQVRFIVEENPDYEALSGKDETFIAGITINKSED